MTLRSGALAALSGILLAAGFPAFGLSLLTWVSLVPLLFALRIQTVRSGFLIGGLAGLVFFAATVHWVTNSVHYYGGIPILPASLITLLLCLYLALYPALFGAMAVRLKQRHPSLFFLTAPALWTALELARAHVFSGFPWALLGYTQYRTLPVIQIADLTGVYGVSFLIVLVNAALAEVLQERRRFPGLIVAVIVLAAALNYGSGRLRAPLGQDGIRISVVQGNIEQDHKWDPRYLSEVSSTYARLTDEALKSRPDLVIWPETATPFYFGGKGERDDGKTFELMTFVRKNRTPLLFGSPTYEPRPDRKVTLRNSAFLLGRDGTVDAVYHKLHLVPFGEYVPFKQVLFFVEKMVEAVGDFGAGRERTVMRVRASDGKEVRLSTVICYEIIFPDLVRRFVKDGATVMTTITNDAWFGRTAAPYQHFSMAVLRAVENRVPVARAANTGVSGFIDSLGRIKETSGIFTEDVLTATLLAGGTRTFYTRHGDLFAYACAVITLALLVRLPRKRGTAEDSPANRNARGRPDAMRRK